MSNEKIQSIPEFCEAHDACDEGRQWAKSTCNSLHDVWRQAQPLWVLWVAMRPGVLTDRELRLFAVWSTRQVQPLMTDQRSVAALEAAERHALGQATDEELAAARKAARKAAWSAADAANYAADTAWWAAHAAAWVAQAAARSAAWSAAWSAAGAAAREAARAAARKEARKAAWSAADAAAREAQANWLRNNTRPNFLAKP